MSVATRVSTPAIRAMAGTTALIAVLSCASRARGQDCEPKCRRGYSCVGGECVSGCDPPCPVGELCSPKGQCVSACNPPCPTSEVCTPQAQCVSACNPPCPSGEVCTPQAQCVSACNPPCAPGEACTAAGDCAARQTPPPPPGSRRVEPPETLASAALPSATDAPGVRSGFLQAGALIGRFSYSGTWDNGSSIEGSGLIFGVEAAGGIQISPKFRVGAGMQYFSLPDPEGTVDGESASTDTGKGGVFGGYLAWGGDSGLLVDGVVGYGGSGTEDFGGWGPGVFPGIGYQTGGATRFSLVGRFYVMPTSSDSGESGTFTGFQAVASLGIF